MKCTYCKKEILEGTGIMFVKKDGTIYNFCSGKCEKNMLKLKRKSSALKWTTPKARAKKTANKE
jgi:large subunit ribosomal protein L24e